MMKAIGLVLLLTVSVAEAGDVFELIRKGDSYGFRAWLKSRPNLEVRDELGNTPLMVAATHLDATAMRLLLEAGANANATNRAGTTVLMLSATEFEKTKMLLSAGARANARSGSGNTPLLVAASAPRSEVTVRLLLERGADPKATNIYGVTTLMKAAAAGDAATVQLLLDRGVDPNLSPGLTPDPVIPGGRSALMWAAMFGHIDVAKKLLKAGARVNGIHPFGTALIMACWHDQVEMARLLLGAGADPNLGAGPGAYTPLHWAASTERDNATLVNLLLAHGARVNVEAGEDVGAFMGELQTPLKLAQKRGDTSVTRALLAAGAVPDPAKVERRSTPPERSLPPGTLPATLVRDAAVMGVRQLQKSATVSADVFVQKRQNCTSCHQQYLPMMAVGLARAYGLEVDEEASAQQRRIVREREDIAFLQEANLHPEPFYVIGLELAGFAAEREAANAAIDAMIHYLTVFQAKDGRWDYYFPRPPLTGSSVGATALSLYALQQYGFAGRAQEMAERVERARKWLWKVKAADTQERVYQLLGLAWAGEDKKKLARLARLLLSEQRSDGGWAQLPGLDSDAYATGQALYALATAIGKQGHEEAFQRGLRFLLRDQQADGTWLTRRRTFPFQPTMESGFPHGRDGWLSAAATSWATIALIVTLDDPAHVLASRQ